MASEKWKPADPVKKFYLLAILVVLQCMSAFSQKQILELGLEAYKDRVHAVWLAQMTAVIMGWPHEHKTASVEWLTDFPKPRRVAPVDDDWYYEMIALKSFEKYGPGLTVEQLGGEWKEHGAGYWGSSEQAKLLMERGVGPSEAGHPRYNKLWFTIGPQFSADIYGALAPGMPNLAGKIARELCHINGYAEGADGGVFVAAMISLGFSEKDPKQIVRKAAKLIHPESPYRKCLELVIGMAENGHTATEVFSAVEDRWHIEYPATNNAVPNGGITAASVWFGEGDFLKTVNLAVGAADFTDADCNAANAAAVVGAMHGLKAIPRHLAEALNDRIKADHIGKYPLKHPVDEKISEIARRTVAVGQEILLKNGVNIRGATLFIPVEEPRTQAPELFRLSDLTDFWNPDWQLERAGFGGTNSGMHGMKGITCLEGDILSTYPRDEVRGLLLSSILTVDGIQKLVFDAGVDPGKAWELNVYVNNERTMQRVIEGETNDRHWETVEIDMRPYEKKKVKIRLYQRVLIPGKESGNAYWKNIHTINTK